MVFSPGSKATWSIKHDLLQFTGEDPWGWIFQAEEYFAFHGIKEDAKLQILGFHMTKSALGDSRVKEKQLTHHLHEIMEDMKERFGASSFHDKLEEIS